MNCSCHGVLISVGKSEACIDDEGLSYLIVLLDQRKITSECVCMCVKKKCCSLESKRFS